MLNYASMAFFFLQTKSPSSSPSKPLLGSGDRKRSSRGERPLSTVTVDTDLSESYRILHSSRNQTFLFPNAK